MEDWDCNCRQGECLRGQLPERRSCFAPEPHPVSSGMQSQDAKPEACIYDNGGLTYGPWCYTHDKPYPHVGGHSG